MHCIGAATVRLGRAYLIGPGPSIGKGKELVDRQADHCSDNSKGVQTEDVFPFGDCNLEHRRAKKKSASTIPRTTENKLATEAEENRADQNRRQ
jgi:hypothetical protein